MILALLGVVFVETNIGGFDGKGSDGKGFEGKGWDGKGWDGKGWDGKGWGGKGWDGEFPAQLTLLHACSKA